VQWKNNKYCIFQVFVCVCVCVSVALGRGYIGAKTDTTQQSGQTPDKEVEINHITVYVSGYNETDPTGMLSPNNCRLSGPTE